MTVTITSKGQITIPLALRNKLNLKVGDQLEFDENSPILTARRVVDRKAWQETVAAWQDMGEESLKGHPWADQSSSAIIDELRSGPADPTS